MEMAPPSHDIKPEIFKNIFLEDWSKLKREADEIYEEAFLLQQEVKQATRSGTGITQGLQARKE